MRTMLMDNQEVVDRCRMLMNKGWVLVFSKMSNAFTIIEERCYKPGTKDNEDFEMVMIAGRDGLKANAILKPNKKLRDFAGKGAINDKTIVLIWHGMVSENEALVEALDCKKTREEGIEAYLTKTYIPWLEK